MRRPVVSSAQPAWAESALEQARTFRGVGPMDGPDLRARALEFCEVQRTLSPQDVTDLTKLCQLAKYRQRELEGNLFTACASLPVLRCVAADATPLETRHRCTGATSESQAVLVREGRGLTEFLFKRVWHTAQDLSANPCQAQTFTEESPILQ